MDKIIYEKHNGKTVTVVINGVGYPSEVIDKLSSGELTEFRDRLILKYQREYNNRKYSIYNDFQPYISKAVEKENRMNKKHDLEQTICQMPREDVISVFTTYLNEQLLNKSHGEGSKSE